MTSADPIAQPSGLHREVRSFLELLGVYAIAVAQPVLSAIEQSPEIFVQLRAGRVVIVIYTMIVLFVPPAVLWAMERLIGHVSATGRRRVHITLIAGFIAVFAFQLLDDTLGAPRAACFVVGAAAAAGMALAYTRYDFVRSWVAYLSPAALLFGAAFLVTSPVADLVLPRSASASDIELTGPEVPVILVVFDELPTLSLLDGEGVVDEALFPSFAELADNAIWYRNTTTTHGFTWQAVPSIQTGRLPPSDTRAPVAEAYPESVYTLLGNSYAVNDLQEFALCPTSVCPPEQAPGGVGALRSLLRISSDAFVERLTQNGDTADVNASGEVKRDAADLIGITGDFEQFVDSIKGGRTLSSAHILLPHHPWLLYPSTSASNSDFERTDPVTLGGWEEPESASLAHQLHLLQTMAVDRMVGEMLDRLKDTEVYDDALIIVTADHGIGFEDGETRRLSTEANISEVAWVPLFIKYPGQAMGEIVDDNVMTIDVLPTIADVLGIDLPWDVDGISLVSERRAATDKEYVPFSENPNDYYPFGGTVDGPAGFATLLARATERVGDTNDPPARPFARGPFGDFVGRPLADFAVGPPTAAGHLDSASSDDGIGREASAGGDGAPIVPGWVSGTVPEELAEDPQLAYVVDETIVATGATFEPDDGRRRFQTLLPEESFGSGPLSVYLIDDAGGRPTLHEIPFPN